MSLTSASTIATVDGDHLVYNAKIYSPPSTSSPSSPSLVDFNTWMVFNRDTGIIKSIGQSNVPIDDFKDGQKTDYKNLLILPGFHDSHLHMTMYGQMLMQVNLTNCRTFDDFKNQIISYRSKNPNVERIEGFGWEQDLLGRFPNADDIDEVCSDVPVILMRACRHVAVVNQMVFDIAGINEDTPDPAGSVIDKYPPDHPSKPNKPTGILKEVPILITIKQLIIKVDSNSKLATIKSAISDLLKNGVTSAHTCESDTWPEFCQLADKKELPIRVFYSAFVTSKNDKSGFPQTPNEKRGSMLHFNKVKFFIDGALGPSTAALSLPYNRSGCQKDQKEDDGCGILIYGKDDLEKQMSEVVEEGHRLEVHVIGDRATDVTLEVFEKINLDPKSRPILVHCQILRQDLIERMKKRGVIASIQPQFVVTDCRWIDTNLPKELLAYAYPWKSLLNHGIHVAGGSDAPVEIPQPLMGIYDAVFRNVDRKDTKGSAVFKPEERLSIEQAIEIYTQGGAYSALMENQLGRLAPGYLADFVVLDRDIISKPEECLDAVVMETWVAGMQRWSMDKGLIL